MPANIDKYISEIESLVTQGLYKTALDRVTDFELKFEPGSIECFKCQILKCKILLQLDEFSDSMDIIDIVLARTEENKRAELYLEALIVKINILYSSGVYNEILSNVSSGEKLIGTLEETKEILLVKAQLLHQKGLFFSIKSEFDEAFKLYNLALEIYEKQQAERYKADVLLEIGRNNRYTGKREKAMEIFKQVLIMSDGFGDVSLKALVLNEIGTINLQLGDLYEALLNYKESLDFYKKMGSTTAIGKVTLNIGVVNEFLGNLAEALSLYKESLSIFKISKNRDYISAAHNNIAGILNKQGKLMDSVNNYEKALKIFQEFGNIQNIAAVFNSMGCLFHYLGDLSQAYTHLITSHKLRAKLNNNLATSKTLFYLIPVLIDMDKIPEAVNYQQELLEISQQQDNRTIVQRYSINQCKLLDLSNKKDDKKEAKHLYKQILYEPVTDHEIKMEALINYSYHLITEYKQTNNSELIIEIKKYFEELLDFASKQHSQIAYIEALFLKAQISKLGKEVVQVKNLLAEIEKLVEVTGYEKISKRLSTLK